MFLYELSISISPHVMRYISGIVAHQCTTLGGYDHVLYNIQYTVSSVVELVVHVIIVYCYRMGILQYTMLPVRDIMTFVACHLVYNMNRM